MEDPIKNLVNFCQQTAHPLLDFWYLKLIFSYIAVLGAHVYGVSLYNSAVAVVALVILDTITGVWAACLTKEFRSRRFVLSAGKLVRYALLLSAAHILQSTIAVHIYVEDVVVVYLACTEFISIMENLAKTGMPIPLNIMNKIARIRDAQ